MGLDGVEMVMAVEEAFQIVITDEDVYHCTTPKKLCAVIWSKLRQSKKTPCPSQHGFYLVRKAIINNTELERKSITPRMELNIALPKKNRKEQWRKIINDITQGESIWAPLERPKILKTSIWLAAIFLVFPAMYYKFFYDVILAFVGTILFSVLMFVGTMWAKTEFPRHFSTVGDLAKIVCSLDNKVWTEEETYQKLKIIISEQLGVSIEDIHPDSHFVDDLGMG